MYSLKDSFFTCRCDLYITAIPPPLWFSLLWMSMLYPAVFRFAFIYWCSDSFPYCVNVSVMNTMSKLLTCMWCISMSSFGLRDCMFTSAILSLIGFLKVLSDLSIGHSKLWCIPVLESHILCPSPFPPLFLLKVLSMFRFFICLHISMSILVVCALNLRFSRWAFVYLIFGPSRGL